MRCCKHAVNLALPRLSSTPTAYGRRPLSAKTLSRLCISPANSRPLPGKRTDWPHATYLKRCTASATSAGALGKLLGSLHSIPFLWLALEHLGMQPGSTQGLRGGHMELAVSKVATSSCPLALWSIGMFRTIQLSTFDTATDIVQRQVFRGAGNSYPRILTR